MSERFECITIWDDPFDIMCGECAVHEHTSWAPVSEEELRRAHQESLDVDAMMTEVDIQCYEDMTGEPFEPTPVDFEEFIQQQIRLGQLRIVSCYLSNM